MILHCVFCKVRADTSDAAWQDVMCALSDLALSLTGCEGFEAGPNRDFERKTPEFQHGFVIRFGNAAALEHYAVHPEHKALGQTLCGMCEGGADGITVFDLEVPG